LIFDISIYKENQ